MLARDSHNGKIWHDFWGMGVSQHIHGKARTIPRCLISLALMCGHVGRDRHRAASASRSEKRSAGLRTPAWSRCFCRLQSVTDDSIRKHFSTLWVRATFRTRKALTVTEISLLRSPAQKSRACTPSARTGDVRIPILNHAREALAKLDTLVVQDSS